MKGYHNRVQAIALQQVVDAMRRNGYVILGIVGYDPKLNMFALAPDDTAPNELVEAAGNRLGDVVARVSTTRTT